MEILAVNRGSWYRWRSSASKLRGSCFSYFHSSLFLQRFKEIRKDKWFSYVYNDADTFVNCGNQFFNRYAAEIVRVPPVAHPVPCDKHERPNGGWGSLWTRWFASESTWNNIAPNTIGNWRELVGLWSFKREEGWFKRRGRISVRKWSAKEQVARGTIAW